MQLRKFANFIYFCITRGKRYYFRTSFGLNVVTSSVRNTNLNFFAKLTSYGLKLLALCQYVIRLISQVRGLYGRVLPEVFRTDRATKERGLCDKNQRQYFPLQTEQTRLISGLLYGFVGLQFVLAL